MLKPKIKNLFVAVLTLLLVIIVATPANARILFQNDSWHLIHSDNLLINTADSSGDTVKLKFGNNIGATLEYDDTADQFEFDPDADAAAEMVLTDAGNLGLTGDAYINWGATVGSGGYGLWDDSGTIKFKDSGGDWTAIGSSGGSSTLDEAYDGGGSGAGRTITADEGAVVVNGDNDSDEAMEITNSGNGGALLVQNYGTGDSFKVVDQVGGDTTPFVIDDEGKVGIGTTSPSSLLDVQETGNMKGNKDLIEITNDATSSDMDNTRTSILFKQHNYGGSGAIDSGRITVGTESDWSTTASTQDGFMAFQTVEDGSVSEKMRINSSGYVGIGDADPDAHLEVSASGSSGNIFLISSDDENDGDLFKVTNTGALTIADAYTFPTADGAEDQVLQTDGSGTLSWVDVSAGGGVKSIFVTMNDMTLIEDGSANSINVYSGSESGTAPHQYYVFKSSQSSIQDIDLKIKVRLPDDFDDFSNSTDLSFTYKTENGTDGTDNKLDILVEDDDGDDAFTAADGQGLRNSSWATYTDEFDGGSFDPSAGEFIYITIKGYASTDGSTEQNSYAGELVITYTAA